ncbi:flavin reductase [Brytella acorum]|uniref:Flavin reductase n=1 Tax=Brytella acorum TaxID=2959299 RepID=A0AA35ULZ1_9PROT|nr:flavin reductase [Brytella acorum]MDF3623706.1 flavin reductase [Brytella acorum]CAI9119876.1 flavin reductase [Brytella acorum]
MTKPISTDAPTFREAMSLLASAVTIITTDGPGGRHGFTASAVCSVSDTPPTLLVCINRDGKTHPHVMAHGRIAINVLAESHDSLSNQFADSRLDMTARFATGDWQTGTTGLPILRDALATLECRISETRDIGTHTVVFAEVDVVTLPKTANRGLVWFRRGYVPV